MGGGIGIHVVSGTVQIANTVVASYTTGISLTNGLVREDYTLFAGVTTETSGAVVSGGNSLSNAYVGFTDPANDDYSLTDTSDAVDAGVNAGIIMDILGTARLQDAGYDIGLLNCSSPMSISSPSVRLVPGLAR